MWLLKLEKKVPRNNLTDIWIESNLNDEAFRKVQIFGQSFVPNDTTNLKSNYIDHSNCVQKFFVLNPDEIYFCREALILSIL